VFRFGLSGELRGSFDPARLEQVFANLLNNAVQHGAKDSPVILEAEGGRDAISVQVKNYGRAIPADALPVIFNPLVQLAPQAPGPREPRPTSLGLGLFIARHIVLGHGGSLEVESSDTTAPSSPRASQKVMPVKALAHGPSRKCDGLSTMYDTAQTVPPTSSYRLPVMRLLRDLILIPCASPGTACETTE
jgi:signal transduction histidine kinase